MWIMFDSVQGCNVVRSQDCSAGMLSLCEARGDVFDSGFLVYSCCRSPLAWTHVGNTILEDVPSPAGPFARSF